MPRDNPFYYSLPTQPADFVGRWPLVEEIVADLSKPRADSWAVIGGRRFGKSSVLKAIEWCLMEQLVDCGQGDRRVFPLVVDLKGSETDAEQNVYARIIRLLYRALRRNRVVAIDVSRTDLDKVRSSEALSFYQFENALYDLADYFERHCGPLRLALLLDEVEVTTRFPWSETLLNQLRALIYDGPLADAVKLVLTGSARVIQVRQAGSPLLNAVKIVHLESFSDADVQDLIALGGEIPDEASEAVQAQSGGHPFIAQCLLHHLWDQDNGLAQATPVQVEQIAHQMRQRRAVDLQGWWEAIGDSGQRAYALLTDSNDWLDESALLVQVRGTTQPLDQGLAALCYHGLAVCDESRRRYRAVGVLFWEWFRANVAEPLEPGDTEWSKTPQAPVKVSPIHQLANLISVRHEAGDRPYTLLLGSSLALTTKVRQAVCGSDSWETFWMELQNRSVTERRAKLAGPLDSLNLTAGYRCLAQLVQAGYFDLVLSLNVDDALDESLRILPAREYQILTHGQVPGTEIAAALGRTHPRVKVVKLHGDLNAHKLPLTPEGQFEFPKKLEEAVERRLSQDTILVGDIPHGTDIQRCIHKSEGALWVVMPEEPRPGSFLYNATQSRPGKVISGPEADFVPFFSALAHELGMEEPSTSIPSPEGRTLIEFTFTSPEPVDRQNWFSAFRRITEQHRANGSWMDNNDAEHKINRLEDFVKPFCKGQMYDASFALYSKDADGDFYEEVMVIVKVKPETELSFEVTDRTQAQKREELANTIQQEIGKLKGVQLISSASAQDVFIGDDTQVTEHFGAPLTEKVERGLSLADERAFLKQELAQHKRNLYTLREKAAVYAAGETPLYLLNQIESEEEEIRRIEAEFERLGG